MDSYQSAKEEIKRAADIVELIGQYVQLKKAGQNHVGLCPFHSEKDPSFTVSPAKQMFHCFGCKKGGDIFAFWMEYHKVPFPQALQDLASRYHVTLLEREWTPSQKRKKELKELLLKINHTAAEYFHHLLMGTKKGEPGRKYLEKRAISKDMTLEFKLGYAQDEWDGLTKFLRGKKVDLEKADQAGLIIPKKSGGYYDRFRGRVIFPIFNMQQQVVGFGGRVLDSSLPKYLNTPETPLFQKGELLYGLHAAHRTIRESGRVVIVEGYTDVLALKGHGFHEVVATLGTALTRDHIRRLKGYTKEAIVVFDSDTAGKEAVLKSLPLFLNEGLSSKVMVLPEGDDPDSFVNKNGVNGFVELLNRSKPMFEFYLDLKLSDDGVGIEHQVRIMEEILPVLSELDNTAQRSLYIRRLSESTEINESIILSELEKIQMRHRKREDKSRINEKLLASKAKKRADLDLLNLIIHYPSTIGKFMNHDCKVLLSDPVVMGIFDAICEIYAQERKITSAEIMENLKEEPAREKFREVMLSPPICPMDMVEQAVHEFEDKIYKITMSKSIKKARDRGDIKGLNQLLKQKSLRQG